ncbi:MAG: hypothetical protein M4579_001211 [Chaenotheca gracillima]|nr:MAG: hypothetical protein M4579_001211 [Chaenotheca gracillima]
MTGYGGGIHDGKGYSISPNNPNTIPQPTLTKNGPVSEQEAARNSQRIASPNLPQSSAQRSTSSQRPPITRESLCMLEFESIINNRELRHVINFNPHLCFKPHFDIENSRKKKLEAEEYWSLLKQDFQNSLSPLQACDQNPAGDERIRDIFCEVKHILRTLVPERDLQLIGDILDVDLLMQQVRRKVLDYPRLASSLADVVYQHCAPMRDDCVHKMVTTIGRGAANQDVECLVEGVKELFTVLENMKLDVANHQITSLRILLVENTLGFETQYFLSKIRHGRIDVGPSRHWFTECQAHSRPEEKPTSVFVRGVVDLVLSANDDAFPATFQFDDERLKCLRWDLQNVIAVQICVDIFERASYELAVWPLPREILESLRGRIKILLGRDGICLEKMSDAAIDIGSCLEHVSGGRFRLSEASLISITRHLQEDSSRDSQAWKRRENDLRQPLLSEVQRRMEEFSKLPILAIADIALHNLELEKNQFGPSFAYITRTLAHLSTIHWRVWAPILYLRPDEVESESGNQEDHVS